MSFQSLRGSCLAVAVLLAWMAPAASADGSASSSGIAVMPFSAGANAAPDERIIAELVALRMAEISALRVVPPSRIGTTPVDSPEAEQVRLWASNFAVDSLLLGRILESSEGRVVEVDLLSGHSGGPISQHRAPLLVGSEFDSLVAELATAVLEDLDVPLLRPPPPVAAAPPVSVEGGRADPAEVFEESSGSGALFSRSSDEPLSIDSEELELVEGAGAGDRHLIFRRNVRVRQGDIQLLTEKLEAFYESGSSQPERLVATGDVRVVQGERRARCDRAVYQRAAQTIVCTGHAELVQRCDRVRGPRIEFDLGRDHVVVLGGASVLIQPAETPGQGCPVEGA